MRGLSVSSIKGYRSMLSAVFRFHLPDLFAHPVLRDLLRSFRVSAPSCLMRPPAWDLSKVLQFLIYDAFEPLRDAPLRALSKEVLFLLAVATAKRVGELQAISRIVSFVGDNACLSYVPEFMAKSESLTRSILHSFLARSLSDFAAGLDDDLLLCLVRALCIYLDRTLSLAPSRRRLFVSLSCPTRAMSKNAVSFFLREVIQGAEVGPIRAHDIRGVSTSVAFHRNWSVSAVLDEATWSSGSVFTSFYLRNLQHEFQGLRSLGPFEDRGALTSSRFVLGEEEDLCRPCLRGSVTCFSYSLWWPVLPVPVKVLGYPVWCFYFHFIEFILFVSFLFVLCVSQPKMSHGVVLYGHVTSDLGSSGIPPRTFQDSVTWF